MISIWYFVILIIFFWPSLFEKSIFVESQLPAGHEHNLAKEAAQSGCCARPQVGIGGTGAISGAWTISGEKCVATGKTIVDSSFKTLGMCHLKVFHKLRDLIWRLPRTKSLLKLVPAQHDLIWVMLLSIFFSYTLFFITCICRILFKHQLLSFDLTHCFQGQWWVGGMTSDRFCWLKGLFETSHFEKRSQKRSDDQMYDLRKNQHPLLSRHENIRWIICLLFLWCFPISSSIRCFPPGGVAELPELSGPKPVARGLLWLRREEMMGQRIGI